MFLSEGVAKASRDDCFFKELFFLEVFFGRFLLREDFFFGVMPYLKYKAASNNV